MVGREICITFESGRELGTEWRFKEATAVGTFPAPRELLDDTSFAESEPPATATALTESFSLSEAVRGGISPVELLEVRGSRPR